MIRNKIWAEKFKKKYGFYPICGGGGGGKAKAEGGISETGSRVYGAGAMTPEEETQYRSSFGLGRLIEQIYKYQMGLAEAPSGYLSPQEAYLRESGDIGKALYDQTLTEARDPYAFYQSTLDPEMKLAMDYVNAQSARRGLLKSGLNVEDMGRAGVDLAIKSARDRMAARESALARAAGLTEYMTGGQQNRLANIANLYSGQQQAGLTARGRQAQQAVAAGQYWAYPYQARLGDIYGRNAALYALPGQLLGAGGQIGMGMAMACWVAKEIFGSWEHPKTISTRYFINKIAYNWFKNFYLKYGERIAQFISNKVILKILLRPLFEIFAYIGNKKSEVIYGLI